MKKFTLFLMSMFLFLGTSMAQDDAGFKLVSTKPSSDKPVSRVNTIELEFSKDVTVTIPEGGIAVVNNETGEALKLTRLNEYAPANYAVFMFEQKSVAGKDGKEELMEQYLDVPGTYSYTIPAGCIKSVDGEEFAEQTFTFSITTPFSVASYTPNGNVDKLDKIQVTFSEPIASANVSGISLVDDYWTPVAQVKENAVISDDKMTVTLELDNPITTTGNYYLNIYNNSFISESGKGNEYATLYFSIVDLTPSFSTNIQDGAVLGEIGNLEITFNNVNEVKLIEDADGVVAYVPGGGESYGTAVLADNKITVTFDQQFTEEGEYTFVIPAGMFTMDGVANENREINVTLQTFVITPLEVVNITPVQGKVDKLEKIVIEYNQNVRLHLNEEWQTPSLEINMIYTNGDKREIIKLTSNVSSADASNKVEYLVNAEWDGWKYTTTPVTAVGTYTLNLADITLDHAGESYIDEYGWSNTKWHSTNKYCEGVCTWTIEEGGSPEGPAVDIDLTKVYRIKNVESNKYLHAGEYNANNVGGAKGSVNMETYEESGDQVFKIEEAGNGQYYLKSLEGYYIVCRPWNVDACDNEKTKLGFEFINETEFRITNANGYFKVENIGGIDYPFCDAKIDAAATWVLEDASIPIGIDEIKGENGKVEIIYDLTGRKIERITKSGIYIVNGKKTLVK